MSNHEFLSEELEALGSIYASELTIHSERHITIQVGSCLLDLKFADSYPESRPEYKVIPLAGTVPSELLIEIDEAFAQDYTPGEVVVFD